MGGIPSENFGLGSSTSVTVDAVHAYWGELTSSVRLVREACEIVIEVIKLL